VGVRAPLPAPLLAMSYTNLFGDVYPPASQDCARTLPVCSLEVGWKRIAWDMWCLRNWTGPQNRPFTEKVAPALLVENLLRHRLGSVRVLPTICQHWTMPMQSLGRRSILPVLLRLGIGMERPGQHVLDLDRSVSTHPPSPHRFDLPKSATVLEIRPQVKKNRIAQEWGAPKHSNVMRDNIPDTSLEPFLITIALAQSPVDHDEDES